MQDVFDALARVCMEQQIKDANRSLSAAEMDEIEQLERDKSKRLGSCVLQ